MPKAPDIAAHRLVAQQIVRPAFKTPAELVAHLGAVQAGQDPAPLLYEVPVGISSYTIWVG